MMPGKKEHQYDKHDHLISENLDEGIKNRLTAGQWIILIFGIVILAFAIPYFIPHASAFTITPDHITETSITWNITGVDEDPIRRVSFDGINLTSEIDAGSHIFIQSGLQPGEWHSIRVVLNSETSKTMEARTNESALGASTISTNTQIEDLSSFFNTWIYVILIVIFMAAGLIRRLAFLEVIASIISLFALARYILENDLSVTDIWHVHFILYIFFFFFPYVIVYFKGGFTK